MVYEVTVDYVTTTTVLVEADDDMAATDAVYGYLKTEKGLESVLQAEMENAQKHWGAFEVADVAPAPQIAPEDAEIRPMKTYDFQAAAFFSVKASSLEEAEAKADAWAEENMSVTRGYDIETQFIKIYEEA